MTKCSPRAGPRSGTFVLATAWLLGASVGVEAQEFRFEGPSGDAREVGRDGTAVIVETEGPPLAGPREFFYRPSPPFDVNSRWVLVQDSTFGVVFTQPSGVKGELDGYAGDLYLRALADVRAVEVRALVFNVWGDPAGHLAVTVLVERGAGERWEIHPRWTGVAGPAHEHRTSIVWINRVMFDDESILEADLRPVGLAWEYVTGSDFEGLAEDPPLRAIGQ
jgi:hypothetical protein